jgi:hypothetical protein
MTNAVMTAYQLAYEITPITLVGGIASSLPGQILPIVALTEAANLMREVLTGSFSDALNLNDYFAHFSPIPGSTLINNTVGQYPFANQNVAANAIIAQPLNISMLMICPVKGKDGYAVRAATMIALKQSLALHTQLGGLFHVATPAWIYLNCIMTGMRDVTPSDSNPKQVAYQMDFLQPLVTQTAAASAQNNYIQKLTAQVPA